MQPGSDAATSRAGQLVQRIADVYRKLWNDLSNLIGRSFANHIVSFH